MFDTLNPADTVHVLVPGGYSDTESDYLTLIAGDIVSTLGDTLAFSQSGFAHVFIGGRTPWEEHDAYPDYVIADWSHPDSSERPYYSPLFGNEFIRVMPA